MADLKFIGSSDAFTRATGDGHSLAKEGALNGSLNFTGPRANVNSFLTGWPNGVSHPDQPLIKKVGHQISYKGPIATVSMQFEGIDPVEGGGSSGEGTKKRTEKVKRRAMITKNSTGVEYYVDYLAPVVTVVWTSGAEPSAPRKEGTSGIAGKTVELDTATPKDSDEAFVVGNVYDYFTFNTDYGITPLNIGFTIENSGDDYVITELWTLAVFNKA